MNAPIAIGISACLFGQNTRYDGGNRHEPRLMETLGQSLILMPLCPEAECGLGIPREPMRLEGDPENPRLMTIASHRDLTAQMRAWANQRLEALMAAGIGGLVLKSRSPSCGKRVAVHGKEEGRTAYRPGLFAGLVMERFPGLPIADEEELRDPDRLADFLKRSAGHGCCNQEDRR